MSSFNLTEFEQVVAKLLAQHKAQRVFNFHYQDQSFWLKQPERVTGVWRLLKPQPKKAFQTELCTLLQLAKQGAPVPEVVLQGEDFFVLRDVGKTISSLCSYPIDNALKQQYLNEATQALINLHQLDLVHGRPALRDIAWQQDQGQTSQIHFMDFESHITHGTLKWRKMRDVLIFIHSIFREKDEIDEALAQQSIQYYIQHGDPEIWQMLIAFIYRYRFVYCLLRPLRKVAKTDLIAILKLFENLLPYYQSPTSEN